MGRGEVVEDHVTSRDGTRIGFLGRGSGPGVVLVQGATGTAHDYSDLAEAMASRFTVYAVDRRGRGLSPRPYEAGHSIARDVEDVDAVLEQTGARQVFGLSSGAVITLEAARTFPRISRAAVYEPPFYVDGIDRVGVGQLGADLERGDLPSALVRSLLVAGTAPAALRALPWPLARLLARGVLWADDRRPGPAARLSELLPGIRYDFADVAAVDGAMGTFASVASPVLLLSGTKSPEFLQRSVRALSDVLPQSQHVELRGLDHSGPWNRGRGGRPRVVAAALSAFFT